jgi:5-oxoprolinase (ATP-hydrolysing) subunit A
LQVDLNCDMGERSDHEGLETDRALLDHITSANIACGFHAGDESTMRFTIERAQAKGVAVGAHPGLRDPEGHGRRYTNISLDDAYDIVREQIATLADVAAATGSRLAHVKPHGALYNAAAVDRRLADAIARAVFDSDRSLILFGLAGSELVQAGTEVGLHVASEGFADRRYNADGTLVSRDLPDAVIADETEAAEQSVALVRAGKATAVDGTELDLHIDTICIHSDTPGAIGFARSIRRALKEAGVTAGAPRAGNAL